MARTVKPQEYASKRGEILDAAQRMIFTKGFEQTSVQDILDELRISNGAFHHYFGSREALLDGLIERIRQGSELPLLPIVHDPHLTAIEKLQGFFDTLDGLRMAHKADVAAAMRVWYTDDNALVRQKVDEAVLQQRAPLVVEIVRQGIQEGVFTTAYPDQAGEVVLAMLQGMGNAHARLLLSLTREGGAEGERIQPEIEKIVSIHVAYMDAIERVLGAPPNCLHRADLEAVKVWAVTLRGAGRE